MGLREKGRLEGENLTVAREVSYGEKEKDLSTESVKGGRANIGRRKIFA